MNPAKAIINKQDVPQAKEVKYLSLTTDAKLVCLLKKKVKIQTDRQMF